MKIAVVGAGIAGLAAATWLRQRGHDVEVLEASDRPGGRAVTVTRPDTGDLLDCGTQYFHTNYHRALGLIESVGLTPDLHRIRGRTRWFDEATPGGSFLLSHRMPWVGSLGLSGNTRLGAFLLRTLRHQLREPYALGPQSSADDVDACAQAHPLVTKHVLRPLLTVGALAEPEHARPSLLQIAKLIRIVLMTDYLCLSRGNAELHHRLAAALPVRLTSPVAGLVEESGRVRGVRIADTDEVVACDRVLIATTPGAASNLLGAGYEKEKTFLDKIACPPFALLNLYLDRPLEDGVWAYVMPPKEDALITMCVNAAQKNPRACPSGKTTLQIWCCYPASSATCEMPDSDMLARCLGELETYFPKIQEWLTGYHVVRHAYGVPWSPVGHQREARVFLQPRASQVTFCGDYLTGGYAESTLWSAERAVGAIEGVARN